MLTSTVLLACVLGQEPHPTSAASRPGSVPGHVAVPDPADLPAFPYDRYRTTDDLGRTITFYVSKLTDAAARGAAAKGAAAADGALPLVLSVQGSGSQSVFLEVDSPKGKRIASGGPEAALLRCARERVRVLVVEKPGVKFLDQPPRPGSAESGSAEFRREHTLDRWVEALHAAVEAAASLPGVDGTRVLALGHSEGAQVVSHLAARNARITHVAALAGGGPTQLYDLIQLARQGKLGPPADDGNARVAWLLKEWDKVLAAPDADDRFFLGHPHRRWTSFLTRSAIDALLASKARVFLAQGTADTAVAVTATDVLHAELKARGRDVVYERIEDADHGLCTAADKQRAGWIDVHRKAVDWFLAGPGSRPAR